MSTPPKTDSSRPEIGERLNQLLGQSGLAPLDSSILARFGAYFALYQRWNARTNLSAIRDQESVLSRHFVESIACARNLPAGIETLLDFGSGAGFPGIPIALCRPEIQVTLGESQGKKAAFLREVVRSLGLATTVHAGRAETLDSQYDCVILRAVDRMEEAVKIASGLVSPSGLLALVTTIQDQASCSAGLADQFTWEKGISLPASDTRILALGRRLA